MSGAGLPRAARHPLALAAIALVAFASNSLLCRLALAAGRIDPATFTLVRLASGALVLALLAAGHLRRERWPGTLGTTFALLLYAVPFSFAYVRLDTGIGALVLFGCVQITMIAWGLARGERPPRRVWLGTALAVVGLLGLTVPGKTAPDTLATATMALAGIGWGIYSLRGRTARTPALATTAACFVGSLPVAAAVALIAAAAGTARASAPGLTYAAASGALASGLGYSVWYLALPHLTAMRAALLQLLVPVLAAAGGVLLLSEPVTPRLLLSGATILGGVLLALTTRRQLDAGGARKAPNGT